MPQQHVEGPWATKEQQREEPAVSERATPATRAVPSELDPRTLLFEDIRRHGQLPSRVTPEDALSAVMCTFSRHVSGGEARHVWNALPDPIKPLLDRCMVHRSEKAERFGREQLLARVADHLGVTTAQAETLTAAVLAAISSRVPEKEMADVAGQLPLDMRDLWIVSKVELAAPVEPHPVLSQIERAVRLPEGVTGMGAFVSVTGHLVQRLPLGEARRFVGTLSSDLRQLVEPCLRARGEQPELFDKKQFLERVAKDLRITDLAQAEMVARAVFHVVEERVPAEDFKSIMDQLPRELSDVWALPERP
jgi:uncharacterized protein (DUF2267 family)